MDLDLPDQKDTYLQLLNKRRSIGRKEDQHRPVVMRIGVLSRAKGSAYVEYQNTKVICSVFDPREIPNKSEYSINGELYCEFKFASFSSSKKRGLFKDAEEKEHSVYLKRALEPAVMRHQFPNFQVDIYVMVLENDGSCLATAITCANLALANAGVPMHDLVTAVSLGLIDGHELVDPTLEEEQCCSSRMSEDGLKSDRGLMTLSFMKIFQQVTEVVFCGVITNSCFEKYVEKLTAENEKMYELSRQCLVRSIMKTLKEKETLKKETGDC